MRELSDVQLNLNDNVAKEIEKFQSNINAHRKNNDVSFDEAYHNCLLTELFATKCTMFELIDKHLTIANRIERLEERMKYVSEN